jgi:hypothetical protein
MEVLHIVLAQNVLLLMLIQWVTFAFVELQILQTACS